MRIAISFTFLLICLVSCKQEKEFEQSDRERINISDQWIRPGVKGRNTAAFMRISNNTEVEDTLYSAFSKLAKVVEIHETFTKEDDLKGMRHLDYILIPSKSVTELKPNGLHVMLIGLEKNLKGGDGGNITLSFKNAGDIILRVEVR